MKRLAILLVLAMAFVACSSDGVEMRSGRDDVLTGPAALGLGIEDFEIDYIVTDEECFGSAGSLVTLEADPWLTAESPYFPGDLLGREYLITFSITNTEDGVTRGSFEVDDDGLYLSWVEMIGFDQCNTAPRFVITGVHER